MKRTIAIKREARQKLRLAYWSATLVCVASFMIYGYVSDAVGLIPFTVSNAVEMFMFPDSPLLLLALFVPLYFFVIGPLTVGRAKYFLHGIDGDWNIRYLFSPFLTRDYFRIVLVMGLRALAFGIVLLFGLFAVVFGSTFTFLWVVIIGGVLITIVGIGLYYRHRFTPYILAEDPLMKFTETKYRNEDIISDDSKFKRLFVVDFSFMTWYIAGSLFFGIGQFFFMPYHETTMALRYRELVTLWEEPLGRKSTKQDTMELKQEDSKSQEMGVIKSEARSHKPYKTIPAIIICLLISLSLLVGITPVSTASAHTEDTESEVIVTTERELRDAIRRNLNSIRIDTTIALVADELVINDGQDIVLHGNGVIVIANDVRGSATRHIVIYEGGRLTLEDELTLKRDMSINHGGGVLVRGGHFIMYGGRIENSTRSGVEVESGLFEMHGGVIHGNYAFVGGGVILDSRRGNARFLMTDGEISGNIASIGGGIGVLGGGGGVTIHGGRITGNHADFDGGGINLEPLTTFSMTGGEISYNHADGFGGAIGVGMAVFHPHLGYEHISIGPEAQLFGNTAYGRVGDNEDPHRTIGYQFGLSEYPQIQWYGDNSRPGTHLINNYDIAFFGSYRHYLAGWQIQLALGVVILVGKGISFPILKIMEKKAALREEELCDVKE